MIKQKSLELIVPPLRFCWQIPEWAFKDVALRWRKTGGVWHVEPASCVTEDMESWPAPTAQEIWKDLASHDRNNIYDMILMEPLAWVVKYMHCDGLDENGDPVNEHDIRYIGDFCDSMVTTMLKAWFDFHKIKIQEEGKKIYEEAVRLCKKARGEK